MRAVFYTHRTSGACAGMCGNGMLQKINCLCKSGKIETTQKCFLKEKGWRLGRLFSRFIFS